MDNRFIPVIFVNASRSPLDMRININSVMSGTSAYFGAGIGSSTGGPTGRYYHSGFKTRGANDVVNDETIRTTGKSLMGDVVDGYYDIAADKDVIYNP